MTSTPQTLSVNEVVAQIDALHGREVDVRGILSVEFEGDTLCHFPSNERREHSCLWAEFTAALGVSDRSELAQFHGRRVVARGTIDRDELGHFSLFPGSLFITRINKYSQ